MRIRDDSPTRLVITAHPSSRWLFGGAFLVLAAVILLVLSPRELDLLGLCIALTLALPGVAIAWAESVTTRFDARSRRIVQERGLLAFRRTRAYPLDAVRAIAIASYTFRHSVGYQVVLHMRSGRDLPLSSGHDVRKKTAQNVARRLEAFLNASRDEPVTALPHPETAWPIEYWPAFVLALLPSLFLPILSDRTAPARERAFEAERVRRPEATLTPPPSEVFRAEVSERDPNALVHLSRRYYEGDGVPKDPRMALGCLQLAADLGHRGANFTLGDMYRRGILVARDPVLAYVYISRSADMGLPEALEAKGALHRELSADALSEARRRLDRAP